MDSNDPKFPETPPSPRESLTFKVVRGGFWSLFLRITGRVLGVARTFILARLLIPEHFGIVGVATLVMTLMEYLSQTGFHVSLIQKKGDVDEYLDTYWTVSVIRSLGIFLFLYLIAPQVALFFKVAQAKDVLRVSALSGLIYGFQNPGTLYFLKDLDFRKQYLHSLVTSLAGIAATVIAAFLLRNYWALVIGGIAGAAARLIASYGLSAYRPRFRMDWTRLRSMGNFGKWVFVSSVLFYFISNGDGIFIGRMLGVALLGVYQMAFMVSRAPLTEIGQMLADLLLPAYSKIQDDAGRFRNAYLKILQLIAFVLMPLAGGIYFFVPELTQYVLGQKWAAVAPVARLIVWSGLANALFLVCCPALNASGKPDVMARWQFAQFLLMGLSIYPLFRLYGISGVAVAVLAGNLLSAGGVFYRTVRMLRCGRVQILVMFLVPAANTAAGMIAVHFLGNILPFNNVLEFAFLAAAWAVLYGLLTLAADKVTGNHLRSVVLESLQFIR